MGNLHPANTFPTPLRAFEELPYRFGRFFAENLQKKAAQMAERRCFLFSTSKLPKKVIFCDFTRMLLRKSVCSDTATPREHLMMSGTCSGGGQSTRQVTGFLMKHIILMI